MSHDKVRQFVRWCSGEEGRREMLTAISKSERYAPYNEHVWASALDDHLSCINMFGPVVGAMRVMVLVENYAPHCPNAPVVPSEDDIVALFSAGSGVLK